MTGELVLAAVHGTPGPKGSLRAVCLRCARQRLASKVVMQEQSETGEKFRKIIARQLKVIAGQLAFTGPVETKLTFFIKRQRVVKAGVEQDQWVPSHAGPVPTHRNSGDVEKHVRTVHDALMDAGVLADDSQVWRVTAAKRWADEKNEPGAVIEVRALTEIMIASLAPEALS